MFRVLCVLFALACALSAVQGDAVQYATVAEALSPVANPKLSTMMALIRVIRKLYHSTISGHLVRSDLLPAAKQLVRHSFHMPNQQLLALHISSNIAVLCHTLQLKRKSRINASPGQALALHVPSVLQ
jgi:hypothetical protein